MLSVKNLSENDYVATAEDLKSLIQRISDLERLTVLQTKLNDAHIDIMKSLYRFICIKNGDKKCLPDTLESF